MEQSDKQYRYGEIKEPEFIKDFNFQDRARSDELISLLDYATKESRTKIEKELFVVKNSILSERNVYTEIKKLRLPLVCMHDIRLEHRGLDLDVDFIIIASEFILMIETRPFIGNIRINFKGEVTRIYKFKNNTYKEKVVSQIVQTDKNIKFLERFLKDYKLAKDIPIYTMAVIGNNESRLKSFFAKSAVKKLFIPYRKLSKKINIYIQKNQIYKLSHSQMLEISNVILKENKPIEVDYAKKLNLAKRTLQKSDQTSMKIKDESKDPNEALKFKTVKDARKELYRDSKSPMIRGFKKH